LGHPPEYGNDPRGTEVFTTHSGNWKCGPVGFRWLGRKKAKTYVVSPEEIVVTEKFTVKANETKTETGMGRRKWLTGS